MFAKAIAIAALASSLIAFDDTPGQGWTYTQEVDDWRVETAPYSATSSSAPRRQSDFTYAVKFFISTCNPDRIHDQFETSRKSERDIWRWHYHHVDGAGSGRLRREMPSTLAHRHVIHVCNTDAPPVSVEIYLPDGSTKEYILRSGQMMIARVETSDASAPKFSAKTTYSYKRRLTSKSRLQVGRYVPRL